jgi:hypothetical protein
VYSSGRPAGRGGEEKMGLWEKVRRGWVGWGDGGGGTVKRSRFRKRGSSRACLHLLGGFAVKGEAFEIRVGWSLGCRKGHWGKEGLMGQRGG